MSGSKVNIDGLADAVMKELNEYSKVLNNDMKDAVQKAADMVKRDIRATAPVGKGTKKGHYNASWSIDKTEEKAHARVLTVHSPKKYMLAHLLEDGHEKRGGGRTRAFPHIGPAERRGRDWYEKEIEKIIQKG